jgi:hypothetical protein
LAFRAAIWANGVAEMNVGVALYNHRRDHSEGQVMNCVILRCGIHVGESLRTLPMGFGRLSVLMASSFYHSSPNRNWVVQDVPYGLQRTIPSTRRVNNPREVHRYHR